MISLPRVAALLGIALLLAHATVAVAAPAHDEPVVLHQPDGTAFVARQFGDEWMNGTETVDGYTILRDARSGYWTYADVTQAGALVTSPYVVGRDLPYALPQFIRPAVNPSSPALSGAQSFGSDQPDLVPFTGSRKMLVILVKFTNQANSTTAASWQGRFFGASNSVKDFYTRTSYGNLNIVPAAETSGTANDGIVGWLSLPQTHPNFGGSIGASAQTLASNAMVAASSFVNYATFDTNGDGMLSESELLIIIIVAGNETSFGGPAACSPNVWGHRWGITGGVSVDGKTLSSYAMFGENHCTTTTPSAQATLGIIVHETGHLLGLPDLYDIDQSSEGVGRWSVMGAGSWNQITRAGDSPSFMDPWSKLTLGWITPTTVTGTLTNQAIPDAATSSAVFRFLTGSEYFLVENRHGASYDAGLPSTGLLIWHIDDTKTTNEEECSPGGVAGVPACSTSFHPLVRLVQADNLYDLENMNNRGDAGDPFPGTSNRTAFTNTSTPNSKRYSGTASNVFVTAISASAPTMHATLSVGAPVSNPDVRTTAATTAATAAPGAAITVNNTVTNGSIAVGSFTVRFYLSTDTSVNGGDVSLGTRTIASLAAGAASTNAKSVTIPAGTAAGIYRILVVADSADVITESNETNNVLATAAIVVGRDLTVTAASTVTKASPGQSISVANTVRNTGSVNAGTFSVGFYLSTNPTIGTGDVSLGNRSVASLAVGATNSVAKTVTIPAGTAIGTYYIVVRADNGLALGEASETNNVLATAAIFVGRDLMVTGASTVAAAAPGQSISVTNAVKNTGAGSVGSFTVRFYLSTNSTFGTGDVSLGTRTVASLATGATSSVAKTVTIPAGTTPGTYRILVRADSANVIAEASETNNVRATGAISILPACTGTITLGATVNGSLATTDCRSTLRVPNRYADRYAFSGTAGQQVAVALTSTAFDTYLFLINPNGTTLAFNDDSAGGTNSRIPVSSGLITLPTAGTYTIEVTSYNENFIGSYSLRLTNDPAPGGGYAPFGPSKQPGTKP
jgi:M6 family metalloprotease-like protein